MRFRVGTDRQSAIVRVRDKLRAHTHLIPPGVTDWRAEAKGIDDVPVFAVTLWSKGEPAQRLDDAALRTLAFDLRERLQAVPGTAAGYIIGGRQRQITIEPRPAQLRGFGVTLEQLAQTVRGANSERSSGAVERGGDRLQVSAGGRLRNAEEVRRLVVANRGGRVIYVADVARVSDAPARAERFMLHYPADVDGSVDAPVSDAPVSKDASEAAQPAETGAEASLPALPRPPSTRQRAGQGLQPRVRASR